MKARGWLLACCVACAQAAHAAPDASLDQRIGAAVPLAIPVLDQDGRSTRLSDYFAAGRPVLLVLGYYRCAQLCGLVMHSLLEGMRGTGLPASTAGIVGLSIDPQDRPADAQRRRAQDLAYARWLAGSEATPPLDLLVAAPTDVQRIAAAVGFRYVPREGSIDHPATVVLLTPEGKVSRYFNGIGLDATPLRSALLQAREGAQGSWSERLALLCSHLDPIAGRHTGAVMATLRALAAGTLLLLALLAWRQHRRAP